MKYKLYTTSRKAWDAMFKAITEAERSIYMEMYILLDDTKTTHDFFSLLKEKAQAGLEVVVIADAYGSSKLSASAIKELRDAGGEFIFFSHLFRRTHRKILIIDGKIAFLGGVNIKEKIRDWLDLQIKISGKIVKPVLQSFAYAYQMSGGKRESVLKYSRLPLTQKIKSWIMDSLPTTKGRYSLIDYYIKHITEANHSIKIVTPYLLPPRRLLAALDSVRHRGVEVEIIIPDDTDIKALNKINYLNACRLSALGVKFYLMPMMNHAKILLIDNNEGLIGSQNMDVLSFNFNMEAGVFFRQKRLVADLAKIFSKWKNESIFFEFSDKKIKTGDKLLIGFFKFFYPIL